MFLVLTCRRFLQQGPSYIQCCRAFTLALARLSCLLRQLATCSWFYAFSIVFCYFSLGRGHPWHGERVPHQLGSLPRPPHMHFGGTTTQETRPLASYAHFQLLKNMASDLGLISITYSMLSALYAIAGPSVRHTGVSYNKKPSCRQDSRPYCQKLQRSRDLGHADFQGKFLCACLSFSIQSRVPNLKSLAQVVLEICSIICQNFQASRDLGHAHFRGNFCAPARHSPYKAAYQI